MDNAFYYLRMSKNVNERGKANKTAPKPSFGCLDPHSPEGYPSIEYKNKGGVGWVVTKS